MFFLDALNEKVLDPQVPQAKSEPENTRLKTTSYGDRNYSGVSVYSEDRSSIRYLAIEKYMMESRPGSRVEWFFPEAYLQFFLAELGMDTLTFYEKLPVDLLSDDPDKAVVLGLMEYPQVIKHPEFDPYLVYHLSATEYLQADEICDEIMNKFPGSQALASSFKTKARQW
jgi:hypothetical protein